MANFNPKQTSHVICERYIRKRSDMLEVESVITRQLGGEGFRCAFLRSCPYIRLRVAALYPAVFEGPSHAAFHDKLSVSLVLVGGVPLVTVRWLDRMCDLAEGPTPASTRGS